MSTNLSRGPLHVITNDPVEINTILRFIREELDEVQGLRGRAKVYDRQRVDDPLENKDAVNLSKRDAPDVVTSAFGQMTYGTTFVHYTDSNGTVLHGFGNV